MPKYLAPAIILLLALAGHSVGQQAVLWQKPLNSVGPLSTYGDKVVVDRSDNSYQLIQAPGLVGYLKNDKAGDLVGQTVVTANAQLISDIEYDPNFGLLVSGGTSPDGAVAIRFDPETGNKIWEIRANINNTIGFDGAGNLFTFEDSDGNHGVVRKRRASDGSIVFEEPFAAITAAVVDKNADILIDSKATVSKLSGSSGSTIWQTQYQAGTIPIAVTVDESNHPLVIADDVYTNPEAIWLVRHSSSTGEIQATGQKVGAGSIPKLKVASDHSGGFYCYGTHGQQDFDLGEFVARFDSQQLALTWSYSGFENYYVFGQVDSFGTLHVALEHSHFTGTAYLQTFSPGGNMKGAPVSGPGYFSFGIDSLGNSILSGITGWTFAESYLGKFASDGSRIWSQTYFASGPQSSRAAGIALDSASNVFVYGTDDGAYSSSHLVKLTAIGQEIWTASEPGSALALTCGPDGDPLTLGLSQYSVTGIAKRDGLDGSLKWSQTVNSQQYDNRELSGTDHFGNILLQIGTVGAEYAEATGNPLWSAFNLTYMTFGPQGDAFCEEFDGGSRFIARLSGATGHELWRFGLLTRSSEFPMAIDTNGNVFVAFRDSSQRGNPWVLRKINGQSGQALWTAKLPSTAEDNMPITTDPLGDVILGGHVLTKLSGLDGTVRWSVPNSDGIFVVKTDSLSNVFVGSNDPKQTYSDISKIRGSDGQLLWNNHSPGYTLVDLKVTPFGRVFAVTHQFSDGGISWMVAMALDNPPTLDSLSVGPNPVNGGSPATGVVRLSAWARADTTVNLSSSDPCVIVPPTVVIAKGTPSTSFLIKTTNVYAETTATVTATLNAVTRTATLTVRHISLLDTFTVTPSTVVGGNPVTGNVTLNLPAPAGGYVVAISSGSSVIQAPSSVTVPAGATTASFTINTKAVSQTVVRTVSASAEGVTRVAAITLTP